MYGAHNQEWGTSHRHRSRSRGRYYTGNSNDPVPLSTLNDSPPSGGQNAHYYGPQGRGSRGRGEGGRTPDPYYRDRPRPTGNPTIPPANQQPRHPTPLTRLHRNPPSEPEHTVSWGKNVTDQTSPPLTTINSDTTIPTPNHPEMEKTDSTEVIDHLAQTIFQTDVEDLTIRHFTTSGSADGTSLLLTMVVNQAHHHRPELENTQLARIAAHAISRHPDYLLECLQSKPTATAFFIVALAATPLYLNEQLLCPMDTPLLLDTTLRERLTCLPTTPSSELRRIITPFLQCFYPGTWDQLELQVQKAPDSLLAAFVSHPGALHQHFQATGSPCPFSPPRWISLSHLFVDGTAQDTESEGDKAETTMELPPLLCPLTTMGFTDETFDRLLPEQQKRVTLLVLPTRMANVIPPAEMDCIMSTLSEMADQSIRGALAPHTFNKLLLHFTRTNKKHVTHHTSTTDIFLSISPPK